ncbi:5897_t:CDS:10, partial [Cetraspora pellucida]
GSLPSINDIMEIDIETNLIQSEIDSRNVASVLNSSQIRKDELPNIEKYQPFVNEPVNESISSRQPNRNRNSIINEKNQNDNREYESVNTPAEITDAVKKDQAKNVMSKTQKFGDLQSDSVKRKPIISENFQSSKKFKSQAKEKQKANESTIINVPSNSSSVYEFYLDKVERPRISNDSINILESDDLNSEEEIEEQDSKDKQGDTNNESSDLSNEAVECSNPFKTSLQLEAYKNRGTRDNKKSKKRCKPDEVITFQNINENLQLANVLDKLNLDDNSTEVEKDKAKVLKNKFVNKQLTQLTLNRDKLFSNSNSIGDSLTTNFEDLFDKNDIKINISFQSSLKYSTSIEKLEGYLKEWIFQFDQITFLKYKVDEKRLKMLYDLKKAYISLIIMLNAEYEQNMNKPPSHHTLRGFVCEKMQSILNIKERQERKYWLGTWRLIELFNLTRCPANIMVEAGIIAKFLMNSTVENYDLFLKSLLDDNDASHQSPKFNSSVIQ